MGKPIEFGRLPTTIIREDNFAKVPPLTVKGDKANPLKITELAGNTKFPPRDLNGEGKGPQPLTIKPTDKPTPDRPF